ncbi:MAG: DMT family transporter [Vulcanimicrobiaceae bacterium]
MELGREGETPFPTPGSLVQHGEPAATERMETNARSYRPALAALAALSLIWGYNWVVMKVAVQYAPPFAFAAVRTVLGALLLLGVAVALRRPLRPRKPWHLLGLGLFQTTGFIGLATWAVVASGAGKVAVLAYTMPFWVALLAWPVLGERLRAAQAFAVALAMAGILCILDIGQLHGTLLSDGLGVGCGASWAIGVVIAKRMQRSDPLDLLALTTWQMLIGGAALAVVALLVPGGATHWTPAYVGALVYNVVLATALAYVLWLFVVERLPAREAAMGTLVNPLVGIVAAWIQLGERPTLLEGGGMLLVVGGLAVLALSKRAP